MFDMQKVVNYRITLCVKATIAVVSGLLQRRMTQSSQTRKVAGPIQVPHLI